MGLDGGGHLELPSAGVALATDPLDPDSDDDGVADGVITDEQKDAIVSCAAQSDIGKKNNGKAKGKK